MENGLFRILKPGPIRIKEGNVYITPVSNGLWNRLFLGLFFGSDSVNFNYKEREGIIFSKDDYTIDTRRLNEKIRIARCPINNVVVGNENQVRKKSISINCNTNDAFYVITIANNTYNTLNEYSVDR